MIGKSRPIVPQAYAQRSGARKNLCRRLRGSPLSQTATQGLRHWARLFRPFRARCQRGFRSVNRSKSCSASAHRPFRAPCRRDCRSVERSKSCCASADAFQGSLSPRLSERQPQQVLQHFRHGLSGLAPSPFQGWLSPRSSERPAFSRGHWEVGRPLVRRVFMIGCWGQPAGESSHSS